MHSTDYIEALLVAEIFGDRSRTDELLKALQTAVAVRYKSEARYDEEAHLNDLVLQLEAHLDEIDAEIAGDAYFPEIEPRAWREADRSNPVLDEASGLSYCFITLHRVGA